MEIFLIAVATSTLLATVSYRLIERPGMRLGRRLIQRLEARAG